MARVVGADTRRTPATATGTGRTGGALRPPVEEEPVPEGRLVPPRWVPRTSAIICLLAVADSVYLTYTHFTNPKGISCFLAKPGSVVNCALVTTSRYSYFFGSLFHHLLPVALAGLVWSVAMLALCSPWAWRAASPWVARARLAGDVYKRQGPHHARPRRPVADLSARPVADLSARPVAMAVARLA